MQFYKNDKNLNACSLPVVMATITLENLKVCASVTNFPWIPVP